MKKTVRKSKIFQSLLVLGLFLFSLSGFSQSTWDFEGGTYTTAGCTASAATGTGNITVLTGVTCTSAGGPSSATAMNTATYPASGTGSRTRGIQIQTSASGLTNVKLKFSMRCSTTAANTVVVQYSTTGVGGPYTDYAMFTFATAASGTGNTWNPVTISDNMTSPQSIGIAAGARREVDFSAVSALNNNANVAFRIVSSFDPYTANYKPAQSTSTYAATGTMRFDDIELSGDAGSCVEPTTSTSALVFTPSTTSMNIAWTNGNGAGRIVVMKAAGAVTTAPVDGTTYTANTTFGSGSTTAAGEFIVYSGTGTSVNVTGLTASTNYCVAVYEYDCTVIDYKQGSPATGCETTTASCAEPTTSASAVTTTPTYTNMNISWTNGNGTGRLVVLKAGGAVTGTPVDGTSYTANTTFGSGSTLAAGEYVVYAGTGSSVSVTGLTPGTNYCIAVYEYDCGPVDYKTSTPATACDNTSSVLKIHQVQGSGTTLAVSGEVHVIGIVTAVFQTAPQVGGFFMQEEDIDADGLPETSEGIYVYTTTTPATPVAVGDQVYVKGTASDYFNMTQISNGATPLSVTILNSGNPLPSLTNVTLPLASASDWEKYEGMRIATPQEMTVTEIYKLGRAGEVLLSANGRIQQFTHNNAPNAANYSAHLDFVKRNSIILDDARLGENPDPIIHPQALGLSAANTLRGGYTTNNLGGVLYESNSWSGGPAILYRIFPTGVVNFDPTPNPRPLTPTPGPAGSLKVASANLLNYFTTIGSTCGPTGDQDCRGADNASEFTRQRDKTLQMLLALNADVIGLMEVENNGYGATSALQDLINGLNTLTAPGTWNFVNHGSTYLGTDVIKVAMIYKTTTVELVGSPATIATGAFAAYNRQPLAATFKQLSNNEIITVCVNHFKSKGSVAATGNPLDNDQLDGQGNSNAIRTQAAIDLAAWLATHPTGTTDEDYLIIGDLNSYPKEDPIDTLVNLGYTNLLHHFHGDNTYSYVFDGNWSYLDHALASPCLLTQTTGAEDFHINSDEPSVLDYNKEFKSAGQLVSLYSADMYRTSDHDPVVITFSLGSPEIDVAQSATPLPNPSPLAFGSTPVGTPVTRTITITNSGTQTLNLTSVTAPTGYTILTVIPATLAAGASLNVDIQLNAVTAGSYPGAFTIVSNDCNESNYVLNLTGTVSTPVTIPPLTTPSYLIVEAIDTRSMKLRFNDANSDESGYEIYRSTDGTNYVLLTTTGAYSTTECIYTDEASLTNDAPYFYIVRAVRGATRSGFTNSAYDYTYPETPTLLSLSKACENGQGSINVKGTHNTKRYRWYETATNGTAFIGIDGNFYEEASYTTANLSAAKTFYIAARGHRYQSATRLAVTVDILPRPAADLNVSGTIYSCGNAAEISATAYAGMVYDWYLNEVFKATTTEPTYTAEASGVYSLRVRNTTSGCVSANRAYVTVKLNHTPSVKILEGKTVTFCQSGTLNAKEIADASEYIWTKDGVTVGTGTSVNVDKSGDYTLTVTQYGCEASNSVTVNVLTFPELEISADNAEICPNTAATLEIPAVTGASYSWYKDGKVIRVTNVNKLKVSKAGVYTVSVAYQNGCAKTSSEFELTVIEVPKGKIALNAGKLELTFETSVSTSEIVWYHNGKHISEFDNKTSITPLESGLYLAEYTLASGCVGRSYSTYFAVAGTDEEEGGNLITLIYPNPGKDVVNIQLGETYKGLVNIQMTDNLGRAVISEKHQAEGKAIEISIAHLPVGMYVIGIENEGKTTSFKFVKE